MTIWSKFTAVRDRRRGALMLPTQSRKPTRSARRATGLIGALCVVLSASFPALALEPAELQRLQARAEKVTIIRDDFGIPHIYAKTDADAVFGLLYAQAEDDFPRIARNYAWAVGRLAESEGESALFSDLRARLYMSQAEAEAAYASAPAWLRELCDAFADGLNYFLATGYKGEAPVITHYPILSNPSRISFYPGVVFGNTIV